MAYTCSCSKLSHIFFTKTGAFFHSLKTILHLSTTSPVPTHEQISHLILDQKSPTQALQSFRWATNLPNFTHNQSTYRALIHKLCTCRRFDTVHQLLDEMPISIGSSPNDDIFITIVRGLGRARMIRQVVKIPDLVTKFKRNPSLKLLNSVLDVLVKEDIDIAREFYRKKMIKCGIQGDHYTFGILMKGLCLTNRIADGFKLLQIMKKQDLKHNTVIYNTLIHALCKNEKVGRARSLMNEMMECNQVTFNIMISAYCKEDNLVQALVMLEKCFNLGFIPDLVTLTKVIEILCDHGRIMEAVEVISRVESKGVKIDVVAFNTLIKGFVSCGKVDVGLWILKEMETKGCIPDVNTYNELITGFCESGKLDSALDMFDEMQRAGVVRNFVTYDTLIRGLCLTGRIKDAITILELMEESKGGSCGRVSPYNSIIYALYKENQFNEALKYLAELGNIFPKAVDRSLNILKEGNNSIEDSKRVYDQMKEEGIVPCVLVYVSLIHRCCKEGCVREAFELMNEMIAEGYIPITSTFNPLIDAFCKQGKVVRASKLLETMVERGCLLDCGSYNPLIEAFCVEGNFHKAFMLFLQMVEKGVAPNYVSWNSLVLFLSEETFSSEGKNRVNNLLVQLIIET